VSANRFSIYAFVAGMWVVGMAWLWVATVNGGGDSTTADGGEAALPPLLTGSSTPSERADPSLTRLQHCRDEDDRLRPALEAVGPALSQWEVHVGAMNKLVVGAISLPQATSFWNQTRVDARGNLDAFRRAVHQASGGPNACGAARLHGQRTSHELRSCARRVSADQRTLKAAQRALGTWAHHVMAMDMLRAGKLSPAMATQMWLTSWKEGVAEIRAYHDAARAARGAGSC
jgi:hypothetical protein